MISKLLQWLHVPGLIKPFEYRREDGLVVSLRTSPRYSILTIGETELYFVRDSGAFDGTGGMALADDTAMNHSRAGYIRRLRSARNG